jgi:hypothetical protein
MALGDRRARRLDHPRQVPIAEQDAREVGKAVPFEREEAEVERDR